MASVIFDHRGNKSGLWMWVIVGVCVIVFVCTCLCLCPCVSVCVCVWLCWRLCVLVFAIVTEQMARLFLPRYLFHEVLPLSCHAPRV